MPKIINQVRIITLFIVENLCVEEYTTKNNHHLFINGIHN